MWRGGRAPTAEQPVLPLGSFAPGALPVCEARAVCRSPFQQNSLVQLIMGQGRGLEGLSQNVRALFLRCGESFMSGRRRELLCGMPGQSVVLQKQGWEFWALQLPEGLIEIVGRSPNIRKQGKMEILSREGSGMRKRAGMGCGSAEGRSQASGERLCWHPRNGVA